jgi:pyrroline-5-carboxylate reductase
MSVLYAAPGVGEADRAHAEGIFTSCGKTAWVHEEELLDAVTALSGSGPAYFFRFCELLTEAGQGLGLPPEIASLLAQETCFGAAAILETTGETPAALRRKVTSPGGTTEAALNVFADGGLSDVVEAALGAATRRAGELRTQAWEGLR